MENMRQPQLLISESLFGSVELDESRSATIKKTYLLLGLSVLCGVGGGYLGANTPAIRNLFTGWIGWILAMVALNAIPYSARCPSWVMALWRGSSSHQSYI